MTPSRGGPRVLFIGGTGRSGTSITRVALGGHPRVATLPFEHRFLIDPDGLLDFWRSYAAGWSPFLADRKLHRLEAFLGKLSGQSRLSKAFGDLLKRTGLARRGVLTPRQYQGWALDEAIPGFSRLADELIERLSPFSHSGSWVGALGYERNPTMRYAPPMNREEVAGPLRDFAWSTIESLLAAQRREVYVEDNTWNQLFFGELAELYPEGKLLHVYRDPRDVVASLRTQRWAPTDLGQLCRWYGDVMGRWFTLREELDASRYRELAWEDLVSDPRHALQGVCEFAGIPFDDQTLATPLSASSQGRWRRDFTASEQSLLDRELGGFVERLGYSH